MIIVRLDKWSCLFRVYIVIAGVLLGRRQVARAGRDLEHGADGGEGAGHDHAARAVRGLVEQDVLAEADRPRVRGEAVAGPARGRLEPVAAGGPGVRVVGSAGGRGSEEGKKVSSA